MKEIQIAYIPIGVPTFHLESAGAAFEESKKMLGGLSEHVVSPQEILLSLDSLREFLDGLNPQLIILQNVTFANAAYATEIVRRFSCPIVLWTLREPVIDGGRLRLNSLTGAYSAANAIRAFRNAPFAYVFGSPEEESVKEEIAAAIAAAKVKEALRNLRISSVGHTPEGFGFGKALDAELAGTFGATQECIEARELIARAKNSSGEEIQPYLAAAQEKICGLDAIPEENVRDFARLYAAYDGYVKEHGIGALSSRCWPDFFTSFGTPVCAVLSMLNDLGVAAACEADTYGALSMYIGMQLSEKAVFFGDPVSMDETENTVTYWHCGTAACSLARTDTGAAAGVHCNRGIGPTLDFGCRSCDNVTVFRVGKDAEGKFRFFIAEGAAADRPKQFSGTSVVVKLNRPADEMIAGSVKDGWEPHFAVIYGAYAKEILMLADMLGIQACVY